MGYIFSNDTNQDLDSIVSEYAKCPEKVLDSFQQSAEDDNQKSPLINAFKRNTNLSKNTLAASLILTRCILPEMSLNNLCFKTSYVPTTQILEYLNEYYFAVDPFNKINDIDINERLFIHIVNNFPDLELLDSSITLAFYKIVDLFKVIVPAYKPTSKVIKTDFDKQDINLGSFQNPCFDGYFSEAFISTLSKPTTSLVEAPKFLEVVHWHSPKKLDVDEKLQTKWELKSNQFYIRFVNQYAQSLVGVKGLFGNTIILKDKKIKEVKSKIGSKAQAIIAQNNIKSNLQNIAKLKKKFDFLCSKLKGQSIESSLSSVDQWLSDVESSDEIADIFYCKARWLKLKVLVENWDANTSIDVIVLMIVEIKAIFEKFRSFLVASDLSILKSIFGLLGFSTEIFSITPISNEKSSQLTSIVLPRSSTNLNLGISFLDFQMKYMSRELSNDRLSLPVTDSRVPFKPDAWQVELLDIVDKRESALICAPTSSGKTFIAYYAMKQILEYSDTDIIVFVAPTKALVNQVAAEVYARYKKTYKNPGMQSWGILTRDYRHNAMNCQILVTVPEMLRILLFSPLNISWAKRIKRVIFDEIHCIGQEGGAIWENLLLAIQVPVLCLSATVGNPTHFYSWLQKAQGRVRFSFYFRLGSLFILFNMSTVLLISESLFLILK